MMPRTEDWAIPKGSTVLVTGANGFIGSHIADQFLQYGFRVRGTVRDADKNKWLDDVFRERYGHGRFELRTVPNMADQGAFDMAAESKRPSAFAPSLHEITKSVGAVRLTTFRCLCHCSHSFHHDLGP